MSAKREQALVGLFVLVAAAVLVVGVAGVRGAFARAGVPYRTEIAFAGGIEPGAMVRYAGGPEVGRVKQLRVDPRNPSLIEISFTVLPSIPVKTDSQVRIMSMSPLGDNHVELMAGSPGAPPAPPNAVLPARPYVDFNAITAELDSIAPQASQLIATLNQRARELQLTVARLNDMLGDRNRANLSATLAGARDMLDEDRPPLHATLDNAQTAAAKLGPALDDLRNTSRQADLALHQADQALAHADAMIGENRPDLHQSIVELRQTLRSASGLTAHLDRTLDVNSDSLDDVIDNLRHITDNLKDFTETIKTRPYSLIRKSVPAEHKPGGRP
ncbi:MAG TPA: MlaD family protein [Candidatus Acidoferrales bacterium]|nr:MlaD family protein [Candidatus Acidoferrales bacterium]